jgi:DHA1 family bicyclomycin/chloramphenicol resistance-like MFS transporter
MDVYVPAIPHMTRLFQVSDNVMMLTLNLFMLTAGVMQLVVGPATDSFGRKNIAYIAIGLFTIGCLCAAFSPSPVFLIIARVIQAIGSCAMMVIGFTIVRDCFDGTKSAKVYSYLNGIIAFSPMFAPFIGSFLDIYFGWRATFLFLLIISVLAYFSLYFFLPETLPHEKRTRLTLPFIIKQYGKIIRNPIFYLYTLGTCFGLSYLYLFCALSPYLIIRDLHIPESQYGFYFFFMGVSFFIGSLLCSQIVERIGMYKTCLLGFVLTLLGGLIMAFIYIEYGLTLNGFIYPMLLVGIGGTFCMGAGSGGSMVPFDENTGSAAALGGTLRFLFSSLVGMLVINDHVASTLPLGLPAIIFSLIGLGVFFIYRKKLYFQATTT